MRHRRPHLQQQDAAAVGHYLLHLPVGGGPVKQHRQRRPICASLALPSPDKADSGRWDPHSGVPPR